MRISSSFKKKLSLPFVLGLCDGIITVLIFLSNRLVHPQELITFNFAIRFSIATLVTGLFVYFVSQYTELRKQLLHTERELNLMKSGRLALTNLGRQIIAESLLSMLVGSIAAFIGAFIPIIVALLVQKYKWAPIFSATVSLGVLGIFLAILVRGSKLRWALGLIISGLLVSYLGMQLNIVS